jgi:Rod binding domain-containing protein
MIADAAAAATSILTPDQTARIRKTAEQFEASFMSQMLKPMFEGLSTEAPFGGGAGEEAWRGFLIDAMAQQVVKAGGVGVTGLVMNEMLKAQESAA